MTLQAQFRWQRRGFQLDVAFAVPTTGVTALFGPSGAGKTTVLRCLAGLERLAEAELRFGDETWQSARQFMPPHRRAIGYVFQEPSLFPLRSVRANLLYGLRRVPVPERRLGFDEVVALLGLGDWLERRPDALSGGQQQRVAIGRALLASPRLLLMDEPLSSLDAASKQDILPWLERLHRVLDLPVVYVSHDLEEVARLADTMVLLEDGRVRAQGPVAELLTRPDLSLARAELAQSILRGAVVARDQDDGLVAVELSPDVRVWVADTGQTLDAPTRLRVQARDVMLSRERPRAISALNALPATITAMHDDPQPGHRLVSLMVAGQPLLARLTARACRKLELEAGSRVHALVKAVSVG